ncbi:MAG: general secretion pathway protein GspK [Bacteriovoracia bacterium]
MKKNKKNQSGIALFMVISALALLSVLVAELTYSTQINSRMAYNAVDNLKSFYLAKSALKLSLLRLAIYRQVSAFMSDSNNKLAAGVLGRSAVEQIWNFPMLYPPEIPKDAGIVEKDNIEAFIKSSKLSGRYVASIKSESSKLNLNNLFYKFLPSEEDTTATTPGQPQGKTTSTTTKTATADQTESQFRSVLENMISNLIEKKKDKDKEFGDIYRNLQGKDVVDAIWAYIFPNSPPSNLPGYKPSRPKNAPLYSLSELHLIPGMTDDIYDTIEPSLTVSATSGVNVNKIKAQTLHALMPELTDEELAQVMAKRDDPDAGQLWNSVEDFWSAISSTSAARYVDQIKSRFDTAGIKLVTSEENFRIEIQATVGLSIKRLEAYVVLESKTNKNQKANQNQPGQIANNPLPNQQNTPSAKQTSGVNLVYWRFI